MKNKILLKLTCIFLLAIATFSACKSPTENLVVTINTNRSTALIAVMFTNANSKSVTQTPDNLKIEIKGKDADRIFEAGGTKNFTTQNGAINLIVNPSIAPTATNPAEFSIIASAPGFITSYNKIVVSDTGSYNYNFSLVGVNDAPDGVSVVVNNSLTLNSNGEVPTLLEMITPAKAGKDENVKLTIPQGTIMKDENGQPVTGNIEIEFAHYDNKNKESLISFPGGMFAPIVKDKNGNNLDPVSFQTLGLIHTEISNGSQKVKTFSNPIIAEVEVNPLTVNPITGAAILEGDSVPIWSQDDETNEWTLEGYEKIVKDPISNKLEVVMKIDHLSCWNIDWFWSSWWWWRNWNPCSNPYVIVNSNAANNVYYEVRDQWGGWITWGYAYLRAGSNFINLNRQQGRSGRITIYNTNSWWGVGQSLGQSSLFSLCGGNTTMAVNFPTPVVINFNISGNCPNKRILRPTFWVYFKENNGWWEYLGYMSNGYLTTTRFQVGKTYTFGTNYDGRWYEYTRTINSTNITESMILPAGTPGCK